MSKRQLVMSTVVGAIVLIAWTVPGFAQNQQNRQRGPRGGGDRTPEEMRERIEEFRRMAMQRLKEQLGSTDEEWQIIEPRIAAVQEAQAQARVGGGGNIFGAFAGRGGPGGRPDGQGGRPQRPGADGDRPDRPDRPGGQAGPGGRGPGGPGGPGGRGPGRGFNAGDNEPTTELGMKMRELRDVLQNEDASADKISSALAALRKTRKQAEDNLASARESLREVLTQRQEAMLVLMGMLD